MADRCSLTCNVKDKQGKVVVSTLWKELSKIFKKDRREALLHYFLTKDDGFLAENSDILKFDANGEVTIETLKKALDRSGEYGNLNSRLVLEQLNRDLKAGTYNYTEALDSVLKFNKSNRFKDGYMATLKKEDNGKYSIKVIERSAKEEYKLADHVMNKIFTDAVKKILEDRGLSVEFLDTSRHSLRYSTLSAMPDANGFLSVATILNGINTDRNIAEVAGHFIVLSMKEDPNIQRLMATLTPEVQERLFHDSESEYFKEDFIVSEKSAQEAAGILLGNQLIKPFQQNQVTKEAKAAVALPKSVKFLLNKIKTLVQKIFGIFTPDAVQKMIKEAESMASTAAQGFITNPTNVDKGTLMTAFEEDANTFTRSSVYKDFSDAIRENVAQYNKALGTLNRIIYELKPLSKRVESPTVKDILKSLKELTTNIQSSKSHLMDTETFARQATIEGITMALEGITHLLNTDVRNLINEIQPADRAHAYSNMTSNARKMRAVNIFVKNVAIMHEVMGNSLEKMALGERVTIQDSNNTRVTETLKNAMNRLGDVLLGAEEEYVSELGKEPEIVHGLYALTQKKRRQVFLDFFKEFYGSDFIEGNAGKVFVKSRHGYKLTRSDKIAGYNQRKLVDLVTVLSDDISLADRFFMSAADCGDFFTACGYQVTRLANLKSDREMVDVWDKIESLRFQMQELFGHTDWNQLLETDVVDGKIVKTGNFITEVNYGAWERKRHEHSKKIKQEFNDWLVEYIKEAYRKNKDVPGYSFKLSDNQKAVLYHMFIEDNAKWSKWHEEESELDPNVKGKRYIPNHVKYHNSKWDELFDTENPSLSEKERKLRRRRLAWYNSFMDLKAKMDSYLDEGATITRRAPQITGRFGHRFQNLKQQYGNNRVALGNAARRKAQDWFIVRADEAWMFGSENQYAEIEEDPLENELYFEKEKIDRLPLWGIKKLKNMEDLSTDIFGSMLEYASMATSYKAMKDVVDVLELGRDVLKDRDDNRPSEKQRKGSSNSSARYLKFLDRNVYGLNVEKLSWDKKGFFRKFSQSLSSLGGKILLHGNFHGGIVNTGTGVFEILKEAMAGENFTFEELRKANGAYFEGLMKKDGFFGGIINGLVNAQRPEDKNSLWIRHWNIRGENKSFFRNQRYDVKAMSLFDNRLWEWYGHIMMLPYSSGDHYMQTVPFYAMGYSKKVYDREGNEMSLIDAYDIVEGKDVFAAEEEQGAVGFDGTPLGKTHKRLQLKEGIFRSVSDIHEYNLVESMLNKIDRFYQNNKNVKNSTPVGMDIFTKEEARYLEKLHFKFPENSKELTVLESALTDKKSNLLFNERDESEFMDACRNVTNRLHGIYNTEDKVAFQLNWFGNLVMAMRGYGLGMLLRRFGPSQYNVVQKKFIEGNYNTAFKILMSMLYDFNSWENWEAVGRAMLFMTPIVNIPCFYSQAFGDKTKADMLRAGWSENQYFNARRFGADMLVITSLVIGKFLSSPGLHSGLEDDDNPVREFLYYLFMRWNREQQAFNTPQGVWNEAKQYLDYTPAGLSGMVALLDIAQLAIRTGIDYIGGPNKSNSDLYYIRGKEGRYEAGDAKWFAKFKRLVPYYRSVYPMGHGYDASKGFEWGRTIRGK